MNYNSKFVTNSIVMKEFCVCHDKYHGIELVAPLVTDGDTAGVVPEEPNREDVEQADQRRRRMCLSSGRPPPAQSDKERLRGAFLKINTIVTNKKQRFPAQMTYASFLFLRYRSFKSVLMGVFLCLFVHYWHSSNAPLKWMAHGTFFPTWIKSGHLDKNTASGFVGSEEGSRSLKSPSVFFCLDFTQDLQ